MKLDLPDVTICAVDSVNMGLAGRALDLSLAQCNFADAILFSHQPVAGGFRNELIDRISSLGDYSLFCLKVLPMLIRTPFVLIVQWDGYVLCADAWNPAFRDYDYIGARWPFVSDHMTVGNGGFSLRSRRFLTALMDSRFPADPSHNADWLTCRIYRPVLEAEYGIRYAPGKIADQFSHELAAPSGPTFGFHGLGNMWRYVEDAELSAIIGQLDPYVCGTPEYCRLLACCLESGKHPLLAELYVKMRAHVPCEQIVNLMATSAGSEERALEWIGLLENLVASHGEARSVGDGISGSRR